MERDGRQACTVQSAAHCPRPTGSAHSHARGSRCSRACPRPQLGRGSARRQSTAERRGVARYVRSPRHTEIRPPSAAPDKSARSRGSAAAVRGRGTTPRARRRRSRRHQRRAGRGRGRQAAQWGPQKATGGQPSAPVMRTRRRTARPRATRARPGHPWRRWAGTLFPGAREALRMSRERRTAQSEPRR